MVVFGQNGCIWVKVVVFGQNCCCLGQSECIRAKWLFSGKVVVFGQSGCIRESGCIRANKVLFGQSGCIGEKYMHLGKSGCTRAR